MNEFFAAENADRSDHYRKDAVRHEAIVAMNVALEPLEPATCSGTERPTIFVFGLPRSGTTLLSQVLAFSLDVGFIDNLAARFWMAPCQGIDLSAEVIGDVRDGTFLSDLGQSVDLRGPHEFSYFWQRWLSIRSLADLTSFGEPAGHVDWDAVAGRLGCLADRFQRPSLFKTNYAGQFLEHFAESFTMPFFVYIERDPRDVAVSILRSRHRYYDDPTRWWATYPPGYDRLVGMGPAQQIAHQVIELRAAYEHRLSLVDPGAVLRITYPDLCRGPSSVVDALRERIAGRYGTSIGRINDLPPQLELRRNVEVRDDEERSVLDALEAIRPA